MQRCCKLCANVFILYLQKTTGITGLAVHPNPRPHLISIYKTTLDVLKQFPKNSVYRQATEALTLRRMQIVEKTENIADIERAIDAGQIEELIEQAEDEQSLAPKMLQWKTYV